MLENIIKSVKQVTAATIIAGSFFYAQACDLLPGTGDPEIEHTHVPALGSYENLEGKARHIDTDDYKVSTYIYVGSTWWMKPYWSRPLTSINSNGKWTTDITTGGIDSKATKINSYLVTSDYEPVSHVLPDITDPKVVAMTSAER